MPQSKSSSHQTVGQSFLTRSSLPSTSPLASYLFRLMHVKKTNLCLSADVSSSAMLLKLAYDVGDSICMLKTHADIIDDFGDRTIKGLVEISRRRKFLIFEDRKFGDIGSTVQKQYTSGPLRIAEWASVVNAHLFPGPSIIRALASAATDTILAQNRFVRTEISAAQDETSRPDISEELEEKARRGSGSIISTTTIDMRVESPRLDEKPGADSDAPEVGDVPLDRGLLLLAEMSSEGNLLTATYTDHCISVAQQHRDFIMGFIAQRSLNSEPEDNFITCTPGVSLPPVGGDGGETESIKGDGLGQQYTSPRKLVLDQGCDVIIVGRGILEAADPLKEAERYRSEAWKAYKERLKRSER
ncbi:MAG: orotidine 5'-phosphate decarboxylase [Peltula sp. TS41687]|nr:MAG: orotidine 5'-phosphate decarboxylase [Peltula sp. TS41687]